MESLFRRPHKNLSFCDLKRSLRVDKRRQNINFENIFLACGGDLNPNHCLSYTVSQLRCCVMLFTFYPAGIPVSVLRKSINGQLLIVFTSLRPVVPREADDRRRLISLSLFPAT